MKYVADDAGLKLSALPAEARAHAVANCVPVAQWRGARAHQRDIVQIWYFKHSGVNHVRKSLNIGRRDAMSKLRSVES